MVPFASQEPCKSQSFPRKRESNPPAAHLREFAKWIPAFAGMTAFLTSRIPNGTCHSARSEESLQLLSHLATAVILRCHENGCAEGTLECGGLTPPSPLGLHAGGTLRRRQAVALQGASRIFMDSGEPKDHEIFAQNERARRLGA